MLKECRKDDLGRIWNDGIRDIFGNKCFIVIDEILEEFRILAKNKDYKKELKQYANNKYKLQKLAPPKEYYEVIDISQKTYDVLIKIYHNYKHTQFNLY